MNRRSTGLGSMRRNHSARNSTNARWIQRSRRLHLYSGNRQANLKNRSSWCRCLHAFHPSGGFHLCALVGATPACPVRLATRSSPIPSPSVIHSPSVGTCQPVGHKPRCIVHCIPIVQATVFVERPSGRMHCHRGIALATCVLTVNRDSAAVVKFHSLSVRLAGWRRRWRNALSAGFLRTSIGRRSQRDRTCSRRNEWLF